MISLLFSATNACQLALGVEDHELWEPTVAQGGAIGGSKSTSEEGGSAGTGSCGANPQVRPSPSAAAGRGAVITAGSCCRNAEGDTTRAGAPSIAGSSSLGGQAESNGGRPGSRDATMPGGGASYSVPLGTIGVGGAGDLGAAPADADCDVSGLGAMLRHRYSFDGLGTDSLDSIGTAIGTIIGTRLLGRGVIELTGANYASLPDGILSRLTNATIETWIVWRGASAGQRIFDFGDAGRVPEGLQGFGHTYLALTTQADGASQALRAIYSLGGSSAEIVVDGLSALERNVLTQVAVVFDHSNGAMHLYRNGMREGSVAISEQLSSINDRNNWLGRSQFSRTSDFEGSIDEFRIYAAALDGCQLRLSYALGPQALLK
ncbi:MAG TPA: LamG domain-containing protein [Polyangiaceae bacterium]|nr:LamG domain-containing protein [Polyangiaceae bacterium]